MLFGGEKKKSFLSTACPIIGFRYLAAYATLIMENKLSHTEYRNVNYAFHWLQLNPCFIMDLGIQNYSPEAEITAWFLQSFTDHRKHVVRVSSK